MNFSFVTDLDLFDSIYGTLIHRNSDTVPADEVELSDDWKEFEVLLGEKKAEYVNLKNELVKIMSELREKTSQLAMVKRMSKTLESNQQLKRKIDDIVNSFEIDQDTASLKRRIAALKGKCQSMEKVLINTNANEYAKFQCFVCMERYVDLFLDPCGHVMCNQCWAQANTETCPGCRARVQVSRKIFTLS